MAIVYRSAKGSDLTPSEVDGNFAELETSNTSLYSTQTNIKNLNLLTTTESEFNSGLGRWAALVSSPAFSIVGGKLRITFTAGVNQCIGIPNIFLPSIDYSFKLKVKLIAGTAGKLVTGTFASGAEGVNNFHIVPTTTETSYLKVIRNVTASPVSLTVGVLAADNFGQTIEIDDIFFVENYKIISEINAISQKADQVLGFESRIADNEFYLYSGGQILDSITSNMDSQGLWQKSQGNPGMTFSGGLMTLTFTAANQNIYIPEIMVVGQKYAIIVRVRKVSGTLTALKFGAFPGTSTQTATINPSSEFLEYNLEITSGFTYFSIGVLSADNTGGVFEIDYVKIISQQETVETKIQEGVVKFSDNVTYSDVGGVWGSLTRDGKALLKVAILGDSLLANPIGGNLPVEVDEGEGKRPQRLTFNTVARRIYDYLSWNKPTFRRIDDSDWTKSGTWVATNTSSIFEPIYNNESMYVSTVANEYVEIAVPDGMENFAFICKEGSAQSPLTVTLNGGSIAAYGETTIVNTYASPGHTGNPYKVVEYLGLPAGVNTIRITRDATTSEAMIWGGFWWSGVTMIVQNIAHGGHTMVALISQHLNDELVRNKFDAVYFQITEMNEMGQQDLEASNESLKTILEEYLFEKEVLISSCNILGTDPTDGTPNYYTSVATVNNQKEMNTSFKKIVIGNRLPFVDLFTLFERKTLGLGGTLEGGDAGLLYTTDGQHGNPLGVTEWFNMLKPALKNTVIKE